MLPLKTMTTTGTVCARPHAVRASRIPTSRAAARLAIAIGAFWLGLLGTADRSSAQSPPLDVAATEALVRTPFFEGMPAEDVERIAPDGCRRLVEMLADAEEAEHHARILLAIGACGPPDGLEAIEAWEARMASGAGDGEIDRRRYRAWQALPYALGRLAEHDPRALDRLAARLDAAAAPRWHFRHHRGAHLLRSLRESAANGLAESGLARAGEILAGAGGRASDPRLRAHLAVSRARHAEQAAARVGARR